MTTVAEAREQLKQAEQDAASARKAEAGRQLAEVRATGRKLKRELDAIVTQVQRHDFEVAECDREIAAYNNVIAAHIANSPDPAAFPSQRELDTWASNLRELTVEHDKAVERKRGLQNKGPDRLRAIALDAEITRLRYSAENFARIVRGELVADVERGGGGLRFVS